MSNIDQIISEINKKYKDNTVKRGLTYEKRERIDFSSPRANWMLRGGIPLGRITEFAGEESSGKSSTALDIVSNAQNLFEGRTKGKEILYVDSECTLDGEWAKKLGVDINRLCVDQPDLEPAEKIFQRISDLTETGEFGLVILDSIAALVPERRLKKDFEDKNKPGEFATLLTDFINQYFRICTRTNTAFIAMNRPKPLIGGYPGQVYYPGGVDWKLACSVRLLFSKGDCYDKDGKEQPKSYAFPVAHKVVMSLNKTKICPPDRKLSYYTLRYEKGKEGVDYFSDTVDLAIDCGIVEKSGAWYSYKDLKVQGVEKVKNYFRNNDDDFMEVYETIMEIVKK